MPRYTNNSQIQRINTFEEDTSKAIMVDAQNVSMVFNMASEQLNSLKEYFITLARGELHFKELRALNNISFTVRKGDVFGILGTNGSGKSTMLKIIAGVLEPSEGKVSVNGNIAPLIELGAGFDMDLTARENIFLNGALLGYSKQFIEQNFDAIVEFAEIQDFLDIPLKNYSSGMVARIAFAIATVIVPDILIVDEVLAVGDFMFQQKCEDRIRTLIEEYDVTVLIVSHNTAQVERLCNKAIWIEKGNCRIIGDSKEVCGLYRLLGGRTGSSESEQAILDALNSDFDEGAIDMPKSIFGSDRFETAIRFAEAAQCEKSPSMVLFNDARSIDAYIATSVSSLLGALPYYLHNDTVPSATILASYKSSPSQIYTIGSTSDTIAVQKALMRDGYSPSVTALETDKILDGTQAYTYLKKQGKLWNNTAVIYTTATPDYGNSLLALMPYVYSNHTPVFLIDSTEAQSRVLSVLSDFSRIIFVGTTEYLVKDSYEYAKEHELEIVHFTGENPRLANEQVNDWIIEEWEREGINQVNILVTSLSNCVDNCLVGAYAGKQHAILLFEDVKDVDSISNAMAFVSSHAQVIKEFEFVGDNSIFDDSEKLILCKRLYMDKK